MPDLPTSSNSKKWAELLVEQIKSNVVAIKEIGERLHELANLTDKVPYQMEIKFNQLINVVRDELKEDIDEEVEKINNILNEIRKDIAVLQIKSGIWGAIGAVVGVLGIWLAQKLL